LPKESGETAEGGCGGLGWGTDDGCASGDEEAEVASRVVRHRGEEEKAAAPYEVDGGTVGGVIGGETAQHKGEVGRSGVDDESCAAAAAAAAALGAAATPAEVCRCA
jgi:hypothetical protein